jgi:hypothetical protein
MSSPHDPAATPMSNQALADQVDWLTGLLAAVCASADKAGQGKILAGEVRQWWESFKAAKVVREKALQKLAPQERKALGLDV